MIIAAILMGIVLLVIIIIRTHPNSSKNFNFCEGILTWIWFSIFLVIEIGIISYIISEPTPTAMDVYQGKTTLEYKVVGDVKVDSVVIFKKQ